MTKTLATRAIVVVVCVAAIVVGATYMSTGTPSINSHAGPSVAGGLLREGSTTTMETGMATGTEHGSSSQTKIKTSSTSLVGSGTAASDLKTLTIVVDDDELIDGLLSGGLPAEKRMGGSRSSCKKNTGYNCGAVFPPDGDTCDHKGCCCHQDNGSGDKLNTCDNAKGYAYRGCNSCWGRDACFKTSNIYVGTSSCHGEYSCQKVSDSTIDNLSCHGNSACYNSNNITIGGGSCLGRAVCDYMENTTIGKGSCNYSNGYSCAGSENVKIGNNSCNGDEVCADCAHNVPDNACNPGITDDMTNGKCNYCK